MQELMQLLEQLHKILKKKKRIWTNDKDNELLYSFDL